MCYENLFHSGNQRNTTTDFLGKNDVGIVGYRQEPVAWSDHKAHHDRGFFSPRLLQRRENEVLMGFQTSFTADVF